MLEKWGVLQSILNTVFKIKGRKEGGPFCLSPIIVSQSKKTIS